MYYDDDDYYDEGIIDLLPEIVLDVLESPSVYDKNPDEDTEAEGDSDGSSTSPSDILPGGAARWRIDYLTSDTYYLGMLEESADR